MKLFQNQKRMGVLLLVLLAVIVFYLFSSQSITTIKEEQSEHKTYNNEPYDIFYTHTAYHENSEEWEVKGEGYILKRFAESDYNNHQTSALSLRYKGEDLPLKPFKVKVESAGGSSSHHLNVLDKKEMVLRDLSTIQSGEALSVTIQWNDQEQLLDLEGSVKSYHEHYIDNPITIDKTEIVSFDERTKPISEYNSVSHDESLIVKVPLANVLFSSSDVAFKIDGDTDNVPFIMGVPTDDMTVPFSFTIDSIHDGDKVKIFFRNEFGNIIEVSDLNSNGLENGSLTFNQPVSFDHLGRKLFWAEVNGEKVGEIGLSLQPIIPRSNE